MTLYDYAKYAFLTLLFLSIAPGLLINVGKQYSQLLEPKTHVGVIELDGVLTDSNPISTQLTKLFKDPNIKAIMLKIDCNGSSAGTGYAIYHEIIELKKKFHKPVIALIENICASGGYWIACATDHIIAPSTAIVGSIGVTFQYLFEFPKLLEQYNIGYNSITAGKYKAIGDHFKTMTDDEISLLQALIDDTYKQFTQSVAQSRNLPMDTVNNWANGKIFTGHQAQELGLIDQIGSLQDAIEIIKQKALVIGDIKWVKQPSSRGLLHYLFDTNDQDNDVSMRSCINAMYSCIVNRCTTNLHC
jgi:protease IV